MWGGIRTRAAGCIALLYLLFWTLTGLPSGTRHWERAAPQHQCTDEVWHQGSWLDTPPGPCPPQPPLATCNASSSQQWAFSSPARACGARYLDPTYLRRALKGQTMMFIGDSITRHLAAALLRAVGSTDEVVVGHADFDLTLPGRDARLSFLWRPYPWNVTEALLEEVPALPRPPSVVIASFCLWHALHVRDADAFAEDAAELSAAAAKVGARLPGLRLLLCTCPHTVTALQGTAAKREALTPRRVAAYDAALRALPAATWRRLGVAALSRACGDACSADGVHPQPVVFDALMQVMLGMLGV
ncbi:hypothetical protein ACKKBG_A00995 [Auxenochlorella protothecoides x Auxenochlorella symbiontica]